MLEKVSSFLDRLTYRREEMKRQCRTVLQSREGRTPPRHPMRFHVPRKSEFYLGLSLD